MRENIIGLEDLSFYSVLLSSAAQRPQYYYPGLHCHPSWKGTQTASPNQNDENGNKGTEVSNPSTPSSTITAKQTTARKNTVAKMMTRVYSNFSKEMQDNFSLLGFFHYWQHTWLISWNISQMWMCAGKSNSSNFYFPNTLPYRFKMNKILFPTQCAFVAAVFVRPKTSQIYFKHLNDNHKNTSWTSWKTFTVNRKMLN